MPTSVKKKKKKSKHSEVQINNRPIVPPLPSFLYSEVFQRIFEIVRTPLSLQEIWKQLRCRYKPLTNPRFESRFLRCRYPVGRVSLCSQTSPPTLPAPWYLLSKHFRARDIGDRSLAGKIAPNSRPPFLDHKESSIIPELELGILFVVVESESDSSFWMIGVSREE